MIDTLRHSDASYNYAVSSGTPSDTTYQKLAQSFIMGSEGKGLLWVTLGIEPVGSSSSGGIVVEIYSDDYSSATESHSPGQPLETLTEKAPPTIKGYYDFLDTTHLELLADTTYWVVVSSSGADSYKLETTGSASNAGSQTLGGTMLASSGSTWERTSVYLGMTVVPEQASRLTTMLALFAGIAIVGYTKGGFRRIRPE